MSGETSETDWESLDLTDPTDRSLITDISDTFSNLAGKKRAERRRQKLREELVREHIENRKQAPTLLQSFAEKLLKRT